jgi:hypothetical protein
VALVFARAGREYQMTSQPPDEQFVESTQRWCFRLSAPGTAGRWPMLES